MRKTWMAFGLLSLLALSAHAAPKISAETLIHGPYITPAPEQLRVAVGAGGGALLYAWTDNGRIWVKSSLAARPTLLPSIGTEIGRVGGVAYNDGQFLIAWIEGGQPLAARVSYEGTLLDGTPFRLGGTDALDIDVVADPQGFRVFTDYRQNGFAMSRITTIGTLVDFAPLPIGSGSPQTVVADGGRFAWLRASRNVPATPQSNGLIQVQFHSRPANDFPSPGVRTFGTAGLSRLGFMDPALATNGLNYFVAWHNGHEVRGARINLDGTPIDTPNGFLVAVDAMAPNASPAPLQMVWDGAKFLIVWEDLRADGNIDLKAAYVTTNGASTWFDISVGPADERAPALLVLDPGRVLVVYQRVGPISTEIVSRVVSEKRERAVGR